MAMTEFLAPSQARLTVTVNNTRPVELLDLTASFQALGEQYQDFVHAHGFDPVADNVRLYVSQLRSGSIIAELAAIADQASFVLEHRDLFAAFLTNFNDLLQFFLTFSGRRTDSEPAVGRAEAERAAQIVEPIAKDYGSQIILQVNNSPGTTINQIVVTSDQAAIVQNNIRRFLGPAVEQTGPFAKEVLTLHQMRSDTSKRGDRGIIERFGGRPVKLEFMNEGAKRAVLDMEDNPFRFAFIVDGIVSTAEGKPALYKIYTVHEAIEKPE